MYPMRLRRARVPAGRPTTSIVPDCTTCTPTIARMSVVLPLPLGPSSPTMRPRGTARESPSSTCSRPRRTRRCSTMIAATGGAVGGSALFIMRRILRLRSHGVKRSRTTGEMPLHSGTHPAHELLDLDGGDRFEGHHVADHDHAHEL